MPHAILPPWPNLVFGKIELASNFAGWFITTFISPRWYLNSQNSTYRTPTPNPNSLILTRQFGNTLLVATILGYNALYSTASNPGLARLYLLALMVGDVGHVVTTGRVLGWEKVKTVREWDLMMWANFGFTGFLFVNRVVCLVSGVV